MLSAARAASGDRRSPASSSRIGCDHPGTRAALQGEPTIEIARQIAWLHDRIEMPLAGDCIFAASRLPHAAPAPNRQQIQVVGQRIDQPLIRDVAVEQEDRRVVEADQLVELLS